MNVHPDQQPLLDEPIWWEIWMEGYSATGEHATASCVGTRVPARTFREACIKTYGYDNNLFDPERLTFWGCRLFDNEADAREGFG